MTPPWRAIGSRNQKKAEKRGKKKEKSWVPCACGATCSLPPHDVLMYIPPDFDHVCRCVLCTVYCVLCTVYCVLCTVYCVLCTVYCVLCTVYCVLRTVRRKRSTPYVGAVSNSSRSSLSCKQNARILSCVHLLLASVTAQSKCSFVTESYVASLLM